MGARFRGQTVIITGASAGIGLAAAWGFAEEGANVVLVARGQEALDAAAEAIEGAGHRVLKAQGDVCDEAAMQAVFVTCMETFGRIDVLVNNAGFHSRGRFDDRPLGELTLMVDVNFRAPVFLMGAVLPHMRKSPPGPKAIVNVASIAGCVPLPGAAIYSSTKFALRVLTRAVAEELKDEGIRVAAVSPGPVATEFILEDVDKVEDITFSQPMSTSKEVAELVIEAAVGGPVERFIPAPSAFMATIGYLSPAFSRGMKPLMYYIGKRRKEAYRKRIDSKS